MRGIRDAGGTPKNIGLCATDQLYAAIMTTDSAGCMVTASHNPAEYNGCKIVKQKNEMLGVGNGLEKIRDFVVANQGTPLPQSTEITPVDDNLRSTMKTTLIKILTEVGRPHELTHSRKLKKIVVDAGNGSG